MNHEIVTPDNLKAEITLNYGRLKQEHQGRDQRGKLTDVLAQLFEQRMNNAIEEYGSMISFTKEVALIPITTGA